VTERTGPREIFPTSSNKKESLANRRGFFFL